MLSKQVGLICFISGISRHAILLGGKRMNDADFPPGLCKGTFRFQVIVSSPLHSNDHVLYVMFLLCLSDHFRSYLKLGSTMFDRLRFDQ